LYDSLRYDKVIDTNMFVKAFESQVVEQKRLLSLDFILKETLARWWATPREGIKYWSQCNILMKVRFDNKIKYIA
jgi:hypothetical protein